MVRTTAGFVAIGTIALSLSQACKASDWQLRVGPVIENFKHTETTPFGNVKEDGTLYGLSLRVARRIGQFEVEGGISHKSNDVDYRGLAIDLQTGNVSPDRKGSNAEITEASIRIARWFLATNNRVALYGGAGYRKWNRDVETSTSSGSNLDYEWPFLMLGAKFSLHKSERTSFMVDVRVTKPIDPKVDLQITGRTFPVTLEQGAEIGYRVELPFTYKLTQAGSIEFAPYFERIKLKESKAKALKALNPLDPVDGVPIREPNSESEMFGLHINWLQEF